MAHSTQCYEPALLQRYLAEDLDESQEDRVRDHLDGCAVCRLALEQAAGQPEIWSGVREHLTELPESLPSSEDEITELKALLDASDDPEKLGRIGVYEICGLIGRGTTGLVLKALEARLQRFVAIKLMSPTYKASGSARRRFEREGRAVAAVSHEHVVPIYAVDDHRGLPYIVMKYIPGLSLEQRIERDGPLDSCEVARVGLQVAQGLAAAHEQGIVHRDVKPANVILEDTVERAMVTDFGLASVADEASMTNSGTISGTPHYMSPEQARGESVEPRSDLFSLGSLMYAACTGRPPFRAENIFGVINRVCKTEPREIREINPAIDPVLVALIQKLMAKTPQARFASAAQVVEALGAELAYMQNPASAALPTRVWMPQAAKPQTGSPKSFKLVAGVLVAAAAIGVGAWGYLERGDTDSENRAPAGAQQAASFFPSAEAFFRQDPPSRGIDQSGSAIPIGKAVQLSTERNDGQRSYFVQNWSQAYPAKALNGVNLHISRGDIVVVQGEADRVVIKAQREWKIEDREAALAFGTRVAPQTKTVDGVFSWKEAPGTLPLPAELVDVSYRVELPARLVSDIKTLEGSILVAGLNGDATVEAHGNIDIGNVGGAIEARANGGHINMGRGNGKKADLLTIGGDIRVANSDGGVRARASDGNVYLGESTGELYAQVSGGDIYVSEIGGVAGGHSSGGNIYILLKESPKADSNFSSAGGAVYVRMSEIAASTVMARGKLDSGLDFHTETPDDGREPYAQCDLNGGGAMLQLTCTSGTVNIESFDAEKGAKTIAFGRGIGHQGSGSTAGPARFSGSTPSQPFSPKSPSGLSGSGSGTGPSGPSAPSGGGLSGSGPSTPGKPGSAAGPSTPGAPSGLGGSAAGPSGNGPSTPSGLGGSGPTRPSGLGGSGSSGRFAGVLSDSARERTTGPPRAGGLSTVLLDNPTGNIDGYTLYLPRSFDQKQGTYPILVYLQGAYGVGGAVSDLNNWGLPRLLRDETDMSLERNRLLLDEFIVISLHIQGGSYHDQPKLVDDLLKRIVAQYKGDANRISVTGLSRGGHGTWGMAAELPGRFAALVPVGGHAGDMDDYSKVKDTSIWIAHNKSDRTVLYTNAEQAVQQVEAVTGKPFLRLTPWEVAASNYLTEKRVITASPSGGHDAWTDLYTSAEFYKWLLAQKRAPVSQGR